jgi:hypothetical protein
MRTVWLSKKTAPYRAFSDDKFQVDTYYLSVILMHNTVHRNTENGDRVIQAKKFWLDYSEEGWGRDEEVKGGVIQWISRKSCGI